ncbi:transient receptor potential cation channel subfamily A member 1-like [Dendronephthya gigantea]|uniref:transient receptor potential cation channel subfamily A member 1-like n=1 Tax=Dendronephthya gigantea TaxID=151771 RepID=UPI00106ADEBD|nr:transient receptor potential cation channel subfamily A member 1-like [Dendronephthya gigantea]
MPIGSTKSYGQVAAGAVSVFFAWINFSLIMKRFLLFGIYIIMAKRVFLTVCKVLPLVLLVVFAFSLSFLLLMSEDQGFRNIGLSILTTFVMMSGEIDYRDTFLTGGKVHALQKILLFLFIIMISIAIMNLLTGLAIGDTNEIMRRSKEEKILHKAELVLAQEKNSHQFAYLGLAQCDSEDEIITEYSDEEMSSSWTLQQWRKAFGGDEIEERLKAIAKEKKNDYKKFDEFKEEMKILGEEMFNVLIWSHSTNGVGFKHEWLPYNNNSSYTALQINVPKKTIILKANYAAP